MAASPDTVTVELGPESVRFLEELTRLVDRMEELDACFASPDAMQVQRLELKPGDRLVFRHPMRLGKEGFARLRKHCELTMPGVQVLVLEDGMDISILTEPAIGGSTHGLPNWAGVLTKQDVGHTGD